MNILKTCVAALALISASSVSAEISSVWLSDQAGNITELRLADRPSVTYSNTAIVVRAGETELQFEGEGISFTFKDPESGSVEQTQIPTSNVAIAVNGDSVEISGLKPDSRVSAFTAAGVQTASASVSADGTASLTLSSGINIIVTESKTFKVIIK